MDPNEALKNARRALADLRKAQDGEDNIGERLDFGDDLANAFEALDGWLTRGGFLPTSWKRV